MEWLYLNFLIVAGFLCFGFLYVGLIKYVVQKTGKGSVLGITAVSLIVPALVIPLVSCFFDESNCFFVIASPGLYLGLLVPCYIAIDVFRKMGKI